MMKSEDFDTKLKQAMGMKNDPKMTVNKLGEFLTAQPNRQRRILQQLKYPKKSAFGVPPEYGMAKEAIKGYLINEFDESYLKNAYDEISGKTPNNDWHASIIGSAIEAIEFAQDIDLSVFEDYQFESYSGSNPKMNIHGVEVSIYPDLIVRTSNRGKNLVGALKIHISKSGQLNLEGSEYVGAMLYSFVENDVLEPSESMKEKLCISYDVFTNSIVECPKSVKRRWNDIEAGCKNIVAIWDSIEKP